MTTTWQTRSRGTVQFTNGTTSMACVAVNPQSPAGIYDINQTTAAFPTPVNHLYSQPSPNYSTAANLYSKVRLVSASIKVTFLGTANNSNGLIAYGLWPKGVLNPTANQFLTAETTAIGRLADGCVLTYRPLDNADREFYDISKYPLDLLDTSDTATVGTQLLVLVSGFTVNAPAMIEYIANYECLVASAYTGIVTIDESPVANPVEFEGTLAAAEKVSPGTKGDVWEETHGENGTVGNLKDVMQSVYDSYKNATSNRGDSYVSKSVGQAQRIYRGLRAMKDMSGQTANLIREFQEVKSYF